MLFNNGYHTIHHEVAGLHWSKTSEEHKKIEHLIDDSLLERSFWWFIVRNYFLGLFLRRYKTDSMRLKRIESEQQVVQASL
jgi:fatty acid desaturase